jgi:hypothetical protein
MAIVIKSYCIFTVTALQVTIPGTRESNLTNPDVSGVCGLVKSNPVKEGTCARLISP